MPSAYSLVGTYIDPDDLCDTYENLKEDEDLQELIVNLSCYSKYSEMAKFYNSFKEMVKVFIQNIHIILTQNWDDFSIVTQRHVFLDSCI